MASTNPVKTSGRKREWPRILVATAAVVLLGWAGIGLDPMSLNLDGWRWIVEADSPKPRLVRVFAHDGEIGDIAWSPDGKKIAAGGQLHHALFIWEADTGALLRKLDREFGGISAVAWSPDGKYVAAGRWFVDAARGHIAIHVWNGETGQRLHGYQGPGPVGESMTFPAELSGSRPIADSWQPGTGARCRYTASSPAGSSLCIGLMQRTAGYWRSARTESSSSPRVSMGVGLWSS